MKSSVAPAVFLLGISLTGFGLFFISQSTSVNLIQKVEFLESKVDSLENALAVQGIETASGIARAEASLETLSEEQVRVSERPTTFTNAVDILSPSVVAIDVTASVPQYQAVCTNPFGEGFDICVPQYKLVGTKEEKVGSGSGFYVTSTIIATNKHVVAQDNVNFSVRLSNGKKGTATLIYRDDKYDVAFLRVDVRGTPVTFASKSPEIGESVVAIGNALGEFENSATVGVISGLNRTIRAQSPQGVVTLEGVIQTDAAVNPGNSGGPLANINGEVVGMNVASAIGGENVGFALPASVISSRVP